MHQKQDINNHIDNTRTLWFEFHTAIKYYNKMSICYRLLNVMVNSCLLIWIAIEFKLLLRIK